jgi:hypothetical protein
VLHSRVCPALPANIGLGWKSLPGTNTLAYYENPYITPVISFIVQAPGDAWAWSFLPEGHLVSFVSPEQPWRRPQVHLGERHHGGPRGVRHLTKKFRFNKCTFLDFCPGPVSKFMGRDDFKQKANMRQVVVMVI